MTNTIQHCAKYSPYHVRYSLLLHAINFARKYIQFTLFEDIVAELFWSLRFPAQYQ